MRLSKIAGRFIGPACLTAWGISVLVGMLLLVRYQMTPAQADAATANQWPTEVTVQRESGRTTLIMALHPHCPCSRASVSELSVLVARSGGQLSAQVLFVQPQGASLQWVESDLWKAAAAIPGVKVRVDIDGKDAAAFGASTSGAVMLYDANGKLMFSGGITDGRGHEGDNDGVASILALLGHRDAKIRSTPVYGCPLRENEASCVTGRKS